MEQTQGVETVELAGKYLTFQLDKEEYGLEILTVQEIIGIMAVTQIPKTPKYVRGIVNLRGKVIPVIDLRIKFGMQPRQDTERTCIIVMQIAGSGHTVTMGIIVDEVCEVLDIAPPQIEEAPSFGAAAQIDFLLGMGKIEKKVVMLLDADRVLSSEDVETVR